MENENKEIVTENESVQKPKKVGKLILSISLIVVLVAFSVLTILATFVSKNYNYNFNDPTLIRIRTNDSSSKDGLTFNKDSEEYNEIMKLYNNSFNAKYISALLQGKLNDVVTVKEGYKSLSSLSGYYVEFIYDSVQKLVIDGEEYQANIVTDESYYVITIEVLNSTTLTETNAYFKYKNASSSNYSYIRLIPYSTQADLYEYIQNM